MRRVVFNGKFRAGGLNGVHRVAARLIAEVDDLLATAPAPDDPPCALIVPKGCADGPPLTAIQVIEDDQPASQAWEQLRLPRLAACSSISPISRLSRTGPSSPCCTMRSSSGRTAPTPGASAWDTGC